MRIKFEYKGVTYDVPGQPKREWKWMLDEGNYCEAGSIVCSAKCSRCIYSQGQGEGARKAFYYECFPEEKPVEKPSCEECADYKSKEEPKKLPKLTQEVFERADCPEWAKWAAVDGDGWAYYYSEMPRISICNVWSIPGCQCGEKIKGYSFDASDWEHSLIERPAVVKRVDYKIIKEKSTPELEYAINQRIACGWVPKGGVSFDSSTGWYMQAMIKKED